MSDDGGARARVDALLRQQDWEDLQKRLVLFALKRTKSVAKASDLAQEAIARALDARWVTWDPDKQPELIFFLQSIVNGLLVNDRKTARRHREIAIDQDEVERVADGGASPETHASARDLYEQRIDALRARLATDQEAVELLDLRLRGLETPAEQGEAMRKTPAEVHKIQLRIRYHADAVKHEMTMAEEALPARQAFLKPRVVTGKAPRRAAAPRPHKHRAPTAETEGEDES